MIFDQKELAQLRHLQVLASKVLKGQLQGERGMARAGPGSGFREHRTYHQGDALRRVDWNVFARMDTLVVKEFDAEEALDLAVVQDCSGSMRGGPARCAAQIAAGLGAVTLTQLERLLWVPAGGDRRGELLRGRDRIPELLEMVDVAPGGTTDLLTAVRALPRRGGVAFVVSDFFDPHGATRALRYLQSHRYQVRALLVEDPAGPPPLGRTKLVDNETGETKTLEVTPDIIERYHRAREARAQGLHAFCRRTGAGFLRVRSDQPFFETVRAAMARGWLTR